MYICMLNRMKDEFFYFPFFKNISYYISFVNFKNIHMYRATYTYVGLCMYKYCLDIFYFINYNLP